MKATRNDLVCKICHGRIALGAPIERWTPPVFGRRVLPAKAALVHAECIES